MNNQVSSFLELPAIFTHVPESQPIALSAYYPRFAAYYPNCELQTKRWVVRNIRPDWRIFDVGANIGYYSVLFGRFASEGHVVAFEPTETVHLAARNLSINAVTNVELTQVALGATAGDRVEPIFRIWGEPAESGEYHFSTVDLEMSRRGWRRLDLLKIDVDSFDLEVLKGSVGTLDRFNPYILVELNHALAERGESVASALDWLAGQGYGEALALDRENFVLRRGDDGPPVSRTQIEIRFDLEPVYLIEELEQTDAPAARIVGPPKQTSTGALFRDAERLTVDGPSWTYAAVWSVAPLARGPAIVEFRVKVSRADIGILCVADGLTEVLGQEEIVHPGDETVVRMSLPAVERLAAVIIRKGPHILGPAEVYFSTPKIWQAQARKASRLPLSLDPKVSSVAFLRTAQAFAGPFDFSPSDILDIVESHDLAARLRLPGAFRPPRAIVDAPLTQFRMETDDATILRQVYRAFRPKRHLEFGTWEGFGTRICAENCEARIWTINLPEGERDENGAPAYADATGITDTGDRIGWLYREAGYAERVVQILADSRVYDWRGFESGFFDTILIDGGHTEGCVASDTEVALNLARRGGLVIWHDFCPDPDVLRDRKAAQGVARALLANWTRVRLHLSDIFWVRPSWLLIGVRNERPVA
jgi:FkbM family methyltransferase